MAGGGESLYDEGQCIISNGHIGHLLNGMTDVTENITFPSRKLCVGR